MTCALRALTLCDGQVLEEQDRALTICLCRLQGLAERIGDSQLANTCALLISELQSDTERLSDELR